MTNEELLEKIGKIVEEKIQASEIRLKQKIDASQKDTIDVLSELIHTGFNMHEERIKALEDHAGIENPNKN